MKTMPYRLLQLSNWFDSHIWNILCGFFFAFISYFAELKGAFHVMFAAFVIDILVGIWASKSVSKIPFKMSKLFVALERMLITYALIMMLYATDKEMHQDTVSTANILSYLVSGFLIYSIAENGYKITGGIIFLSIKTYVRSKVEEATHINLDDINKTKAEPKRTRNHKTKSVAE